MSIEVVLVIIALLIVAIMALALSPLAARYDHAPKAVTRAKARSSVDRGKFLR